MKILVLNNNCIIPTYLVNNHFKNKSKYNVIELNPNHIDITDYNDTLKKIIKLSPDIVIHGFEISNIDQCEFNKEICDNINITGTSNVAQACNILNIPIVYLSSSEVYGNNSLTPFTEESVCSPINIYGESKLKGELEVKKFCKKHFILRTSWCFGGQDCYVKKVIDNLNISIFTTIDEVVNPTPIDELCILIEKIINSNEYGIYNCCSPTFASKVDVLKFIFNTLNLSKNIIPLPEETRNLIAPRSPYSVLDTTKIRKTFNANISPWTESIKSYLDKLC